MIICRLSSRSFCTCTSPGVNLIELARRDKPGQPASTHIISICIERTSSGVSLRTTAKSANRRTLCKCALLYGTEHEHTKLLSLINELVKLLTPVIVKFYLFHLIISDYHRMK